jgi:pimeloyl-ACP methyl ester carboxylesterase
MSRDAHVRDVVMWLDRLGRAPAVIVGQSLGGHTAFLIAARRPDLVRGLVVLEATPESNRVGREVTRRWLETWPVPFASEAEAARFFGGERRWARAWARGLEAREGGLWPRFDTDVVIGALRETAEQSYWDEWSRVVCPTLIVRGESGVRRDEVAEMARLVPTARSIEISSAGHDVHLERPVEWHACLSAFLDGLPIHASREQP